MGIRATSPLARSNRPSCSGQLTMQLVERADRQRRGHVRAAVVDRGDPVRRVREQDVEVAERHAPQRARLAASATGNAAT